CHDGEAATNIQKVDIMSTASGSDTGGAQENRAPTLADIREAHARIAPHVRLTPAWPWQSDTLSTRLAAGTDVVLKLEVLQHGGSFKPRGALQNMLAMTDDARTRGVTAVSAGNHAVAVAYAATVVGTSAKVVVPRTASPIRIAMCQAYGGQVVLVDDVHEAFARVRQIEESEGRTFVHPFEGPLTALGTATLGLEFADQAAALGAPLDALVVPVGGGGLIAGMSAAVKQAYPDCKVYGVEPEGADTMFRSFQTGKPESLDRVRTIADSLGAPYSAPYSFSLCQQFVDDIVLVSDDAMCEAMALLYAEVKLAPEPAGAAATAALLGPLRQRLAGKRVGAIVCGGNVDVATFADFVVRGQAMATIPGVSSSITMKLTPQ
ncbi:MAG: threonine/serine dehydratase, partial [Gemmatimonas sp.]